MLRRLQQAQTRGHLQLLLHAEREGGAVLAQVVPLWSALRVIALDLTPQVRGLREVLPHQPEPGPAGGTLELRGVRIHHRPEVTLALRHHGGRGDVAAHGVEGLPELGERAPRHHLGSVDGQSRAARGGDALVDLVEGRLALRDPLRALRGAAGELARVGDVAGELQAQGGAGRGDRRCRRTAEVRGDRRLERIPCPSEGAEIVRAGRLHVLIDRTIVGEELFQHGVGAVGERLVLILHAAHRLEGLAGRARGEHLAEQ